MSGGSPESQYRLDQLGWLAFDRLCALVLEAEAGQVDLRLRGDSDRGRVATVRDSLTLQHPATRVAGPVTIMSLWIPANAHPTVRSTELRRRITELIADTGNPAARALLVLTNVEGKPSDADLRASMPVEPRRLLAFGAEWISASIDRNASVRLALPSVLGLRGLGGLIDAGPAEQSTLDVEHAHELARVFWPTRAYERALAVLRAHRFVVLTGAPEMGKTAIARMLALAVLTDGWEAYECTEPEQVWQAFDRSRPQVFVADDAFGSTEYRPDSAERWARALERLLSDLDERHWLIWTSRPAPLKAGLRRVQRERGAERFPAPGEVLVDVSDLDLRDKTSILFRHAKARGASGAARALIRSSALAIVEHPHFTPERVRRLLSDYLDQLPSLASGSAAPLRSLIEQELAQPTDAMRNSFHALGAEHRDLLIAMLDTPSGLIDERALAATVRRHHPGGLSRPPSELIDRLTDHFLRVTTLGIGWVHPSWRDLVIDELRSDAAARQHFLAASGIDGLTLALSVQGGPRGERTLPLLMTDGDWDRLCDRLHQLLSVLELRELARVLLALETTLAEAITPWQRREAQSMAAEMLNRTRSMWNRERAILPAFLLDDWYRLRHDVPDQIERPRLSDTWAELHPGALLLERPDRSELLRAGEWLELAQVLQDHDSAALGALGFPHRDRALLEELIVMLTRLAGEEESRGLAENLLRQIGKLVPELADSARGALTISVLAEGLERRRWWAPHDIPAPPSHEPANARSDFTRSDVARVLSDL